MAALGKGMVAGSQMYVCMLQVSHFALKAETSALNASHQAFTHRRFVNTHMMALKTAIFLNMAQHLDVN